MPAAENSPTNLNRELHEQRRWELLPSTAHLPWFKTLLQNEFLPSETHQQRQIQKLDQIFRYSKIRIPYYQSQLPSSCGINSFQDLERMPILSKQETIEHFEQLKCRRLPKGESSAGVAASSGTTGRPVKVALTVQSSVLFQILWQRQARWWRLDPMALMARIRTPEGLPRKANGSWLAKGETCTHNRWSHIGRFFVTGPEIGCLVSNERERLVEWLREHRPGYLLTYPGLFEELALASDCTKPVESIQSLIGVSSLLTESMRSMVERVFEVPIHQNYGMNEVGMVAVRCSAGRYHIHNEHCHVEIVDKDGMAVTAGEIGRVLVTTFRNLRMPLLRYDCGDMATAVEGPCPCGRTLPSIGAIAGRYRRFAHLPDGTRTRYNAIFNTIETMPPNFLTNLRQYQVHQYRDQRFEVRLLCAGPLLPEFRQQIIDAWNETVDNNEQGLLSFKEVDHIEGSPGGKLLEFSSDFFPQDDSNTLRPDFDHS